MARTDALSGLEKGARTIAEQMGYELVDVCLDREPTGKYLRFYIDKDEGVSLDDCEAVHKAVRGLAETVDYDFMEVSSPGADRPLKTERDFARARGMIVELKTYRPVNGAKQFTGELVGLEDGDVVIATEDGQTLRFARRDVAVVRPLIEFDEEDLQDDTPVQQPPK